MNIFKNFKLQVLERVINLYGNQITDLPAFESKLTVDTPKSEAHGDLATNAAFVLSKDLKKSPQAIATELVISFKAIEGVESTEVLGGFINFRMQNSFWHKQLFTILGQGPYYGTSDEGKGETFNLEYVSANPTGPMHAGHARNAVLGDVIANMLKRIGYNVYKEYYINDAGEQIKTLGRSLYYRYQEQFSEQPRMSLQDMSLYPGDYLINPAKKIAETEGKEWLYKEEEEWLPYFADQAVEGMMAFIKKDLAQLGIGMDVFSSEKTIVEMGYLERALKILEEQGDIYTGILEKPKGESNDEWEPQPQLLFKSTRYGDDTDRVLQKTNGDWTYFGKDLAYHLNKFERNFDHYLNVLSADHLGYFQRLKAGFKALTKNTKDLEIKGYQLVNFLENGEPIRMSKRAGNFVLLSDIIERVGKDPTRFMMVSRDHNVEIDFDFAKVLEQSKDNPVFYVQYAHARCCSVLRYASETFGTEAQESIPDLSLLIEGCELSLIRTLCQWPRQLLTAATLREPHRVCLAMTQVASAFHSFWSQGKENTELRVISSDNKMLSLARISLVKAVTYVLQSGFSVLGIEAVEEM